MKTPPKNEKLKITFVRNHHKDVGRNIPWTDKTKAEILRTGGRLFRMQEHDTGNVNR